jgi:hypothetical protein
MITEIGIIAGEIWHYLDKIEESSLEDLFLNLNKPSELVLMSLGWLAREGHVIVRQCESDYKISLRRKEQSSRFIQEE